jgi:hypothetical protein
MGDVLQFPIDPLDVVAIECSRIADECLAAADRLEELGNANVVQITLDPDAKLRGELRSLRARSSGLVAELRALERNVVPITTDPIATARALLESGRQDFQASLQRLRALAAPAQDKTAADRSAET